MPHLTTFGGSYFSTGQLAFEDRLNADLDANDFGLRTKGIIHPNYSPDGVAQRNANDGFQAEGDIKGIIDPNYVTGDGSDQLQQNSGSSYSPWDHDVINASDALTNYRPYEMQAGIGISANARGKTTGTIAALQIDTGSGNDHIVHHLGGTSGPGGTSFMTGVDHLGQFGHEADHFTNFAMPVGDFI